MLAVIKSRLELCCRESRNLYSKDLPIFLMMDDHGAQKSHTGLQQLSDLHIHPIWLPAYNTHFLDPRDFRALPRLKSII
jgi:hypothetical protein